MEIENIEKIKSRFFQDIGGVCEQIPTYFYPEPTDILYPNFYIDEDGLDTYEVKKGKLIGQTQRLDYIADSTILRTVYIYQSDEGYLFVSRIKYSNILV